MNNNRDKILNIIIIALISVIVIIIGYLFLKDYFSGNYIITLNGDNPLYLVQGEMYNEPGYMAIDENGLEVTEKVKVNNKVDVNTPGIYEIIYKIGGTSISRSVEVVDANLKIFLSKDKEDLTNEGVVVTVKIIGKSFSGVLLPDGTRREEKEFNYNIDANGTYTFKVYNEKNEEFSEIITISNIDKTPPEGTCKATIDFDKTEITVDAKDQNGISEYRYLNKEEEVFKGDKSSYTHNSKLSKKIAVDVTDTVGNKQNLVCEIQDNTIYEPLLPSSTDNVIYKGETDTLKVYIIKRSGYYLTRVWAEEPYRQLNKFDSPEYGKNLYKPSVLLEKAMSSYGLNNKLLLGFNASGFYLKDTFDAYSVSKYSGYDKTSVGTLVITDGKVVRNVYDKAYKTWFIMGINPDNKMVIFEDSAASSSAEISNKKKWADAVINSGIRNTFTFAAPLIQNGARTNIRTSMPGGFDDAKGLQMICQINDNNFVLFTSSNAKRNTGINEFLAMGCQTATNLDGGGSIALIYKDMNSNEITKVIGNGRQLTEVGYFTE